MNEVERYVMRNYIRPIVHMREQIELYRFGLVFGTGISHDFGFPNWHELIARIAGDERVDGKQLLSISKSKTTLSQLLFQNYSSKVIKELETGFDKYDRLYSHIQAGWHRIIRDALYKDVPDNLGELKEKDKYLSEFLEIIKDTKLTVNYNFDDTLQTLLGEHITKEGRGFRTIWSADIQLYPQNGVIYHPNGFLPRDPGEKPSDDLIFLEGTFGDQLMESVSGHYAALSYHFSQNTCLLIGLSLEDSTLKHLLRKNAILHPGHVHYYVHFLDDGQQIDEERRQAITDANFEVYNLVTLFLDRKGLAILGRLLKMEPQHIGILADELGVPMTYKYFLTGSVCVGKSTAISHFRSLRTHDEWLDKRTPGMEMDPSKVDQESIERIDKFVAEQWRQKNYILSKVTHGIHIIDRSPLDAFAFTPKHEWIKKAAFTRKVITPDQSRTQLCKGKVILMIGDPQIMAVRATKLQKVVSADKLHERQELYRIIYHPDNPGILLLDTCNKPIQRVVKEICRIIHLDHYQECNLQNRLDLIESGTIYPKN